MSCRPLLAVALAAALPAAAADSRDFAAERALHQRLRQDFAACDHPAMALPRYRNYNPERELLRELRAMLHAPVEACPGTPGRAVAFLSAAVGDPIRPDVLPALIEMLEGALREGRGTAPDPARADALARYLWLVSDRDPPGWSEAEREAWLIRPETIAMLEARVAAAPTARAIWLLSSLLLRRELAVYDAGRAATLLESSPEIYRDPVRLRLAALLSDGIHLPPDYRRAARPFRASATGPAGEAAAAQRVLLSLGERAAAAARTPDERLAAVAILAPAALDGLDGGAHARALARIGARTRAEPLPPDRVEWISSVLDLGFANMLDLLPETTPPGSRPIVLRGLVGADGRLATVALVQSSGVPERDRAVLAVYLRSGADVDLSSVAGGSPVWVTLPPVDPMLDHATVYAAIRARCPACM
jgi:hypothetical protein